MSAAVMHAPIPDFHLLMWPVIGPVSSGFGYRTDPITRGHAFHPGIDIAAGYGDEVLATADGVVVTVERRREYGRLVVINHGSGMTTWYAHLSRFNIEPGASVHAGDVIGYEGRSGRCTGPHLHYEVRVRNQPVNPWRYLRVLEPRAGRQGAHERCFPRFLNLVYKPDLLL